ncbi:MAG TPA: hypothetical protein VES93_15425 [Ornithinibacter sp.]|nr:hypothetical protein [Ornithinibacter sp.]
MLLWTVLLAGSAAFLAWRARRVWGSATTLGREVQRASELVAELEQRADELRVIDPSPTAVTQPPRRLRAEYREQRGASKAARRARRSDRLPPWARVH